MTRKNLKSSAAVSIAATSLSKIAAIAGGAPPLLPGESEQGYLEGRQGAIEELGARTHLQVYLAEKIFDCLWWMRAYETQKRATYIRSMVDRLIGTSSPPARLRLSIAEAITAGNWQHEGLENLMLQSGFTPESLLQQAMTVRPDYQARLEELIALRAKMLVSLQTSYEALVNRSIVQERLKLHNDLLRRDLTAIDVAAIPSSAKTPEVQADDEPSKARR